MLALMRKRDKVALVLIGEIRTKRIDAGVETEAVVIDFLYVFELLTISFNAKRNSTSLP